MTDSSQHRGSTGIGSGPEWGTTAFSTGDHVGLVGRHTIGLVDGGDPTTRARLWPLVSTDQPLDDILEALSSTGIKVLPDFALAQVEGDDVRVVARGGASVSAELADGSERSIDATGVRTWVEVVISDVASVTMAMPGSSGSTPEFAVLAGSVPAGLLVRRFDEADQLAADGDSWSGSIPLTPSMEAERATPDADLDADVDADTDASTESGSSEASGQPSGFSDAGDADVNDVDVSDAGAGSSEASSPWSPGLAVDTSGAMPATPQPPPPAAPVVQISTMPDVDAPSRTAPSADEPDSRLGGPAPFDAQADLESTLIDDDESVSGALAESGAESGADAASAGPVAVLAFSNGERIEVDRTVLVGRNPKFDGSGGGPIPYLMKYEGPGQGLSRSHAEFRVEDGQLVIEDLRSTNGTDVQPPGEGRTRLEGGVGVTLVAGTLIDFGDELRCMVETPR